MKFVYHLHNLQKKRTQSQLLKDIKDFYTLRKNSYIAKSRYNKYIIQTAGSSVI